MDGQAARTIERADSPSFLSARFRCLLKKYEECDANECCNADEVNESAVVPGIRHSSRGSVGIVHLMNHNSFRGNVGVRQRHSINHKQDNGRHRNDGQATRRKFHEELP